MFNPGGYPLPRGILVYIPAHLWGSYLNNLLFSEPQKKVVKIHLLRKPKKSREDSVTWKLKKNRPPKYARFLIKNIHFATPAILTGRTFV